MVLISKNRVGLHISDFTEVMPWTEEVYKLSFNSFF